VLHAESVALLLDVAKTVGGAIIGALTVWLTFRRDQNSSLQELVKIAAEDLLEAAAKEVARARDLLEAERRAWETERKRWQSERTDLHRRVAEMEMEIKILRQQVNGNQKGRT